MGISAKTLQGGETGPGQPGNFLQQRLAKFLSAMAPLEKSFAQLVVPNRLKASLPIAVKRGAATSYFRTDAPGFAVAAQIASADFRRVQRFLQARPGLNGHRR